jgi:soluble lytic murein transglycosylase-like protein
MPSENHLTIRDYFNRVIGGKPRNRKKLAPNQTKLSDASAFHRILTSQRKQRSTKPQAKSGGLKIADYLAKPVRAKSRFKPRPVLPSANNKIAATDIFSGHPALFESKGSPKIASAPPHSIKNDLSRLRAAGLRSLQKPAGTGDRQQIETSILKAAQKYNLPVNLIKSVIRAESNFQVKAVSHAGAQGLMQLMPATAQELGVKNPFNIAENIDGGSRYLRKMLDSFGGDLKLALAAYNAGPEAVIKYGGKVPPFRETQQYVNRVLRFTRQTA